MPVRFDVACCWSILSRLNMEAALIALIVFAVMATHLWAAITTSHCCLLTLASLYAALFIPSAIVKLLSAAGFIIIFAIAILHLSIYVSDC
jgi:hypothetical protein